MLVSTVTHQNNDKRETKTVVYHLKGNVELKRERALTS